MPKKTASQSIRESLDHPVIDADGHFVEFVPLLNQYLRDEGVSGGMPEAMRAGEGLGRADHDLLSPDERVAHRATIKPWGLTPVENVIDLASSIAPRLLHRRLDELGIDFAVLYPSAALAFMHIRDDDLRRASCRAVNRYASDTFAELGDRLCTVASIPMQTPDEAVAEMEFCVRELGFKSALIAGWARRSVPAFAHLPKAAEHATWLDFFGIDSAYDYDPVWAKAVELGLPLAMHSTGMGWGSRRSISNYVFNHIGHFAASMEGSAKALFLGGVTRRFPRLRIAFLEGGVHWAVSLYGDLISHWEKRNIEAVQQYDLQRLDRNALMSLLLEHGQELLAKIADPSKIIEESEAAAVAVSGSGGLVDDFAALHIRRAEEIADLFVPSFYFGCEADDPMIRTAFNTKINPFGARLNAIFSSDIGHWDVPDMTEVLEEAYENVENGSLDSDDFRAFVFANVARFYIEANPDFFEGSVVEQDVATLKAAGVQPSGEASAEAPA